MFAMRSASQGYVRFLLFIAGLGGLLYGIDIGIIAAALLFVSKTIDLTISQTSQIVAAVLGGGMLSSLIAGALADWFGRRKMMIASGLIFVASVGLIVLSRGFISLFLGRLLQGMSGGIIAVVAPLYLAESLPAKSRGRGTAIFQFMLTFGIVLAAIAGWFYTRQAEAAIALAAGHPEWIRAAENHAWREMFLAIVYPGALFFLGAFVLSETPRWLFGRGRIADALASLRRSMSEEEAETEMAEMEAIALEHRQARSAGTSDSLLQKKYVVPFLLACLILVFNQTTGINSILSFLVMILQQAGMSLRHATQGDVAVKVLNCAATVVAIFLVDRKGRKYLLKLGTAGIVISLAAAALLCLSFESGRLDIHPRLQAMVRNNALTLAVNRSALAANSVANSAVHSGPSPSIDSSARPLVLTVLYSYGSGSKMTTVVESDPDPTLRIAPEAGAADAGKPLVIERALYGPVPPEKIGWLLAAALSLFIASFAVGPGVVVWLALSELMPTRIRSIGMGIALLLNQGASTLIAALFLPVAGRIGYYAIFVFWSAASVAYFLTATFLLPETKGQTLEEIEQHFERA